MQMTAACPPGGADHLHLPLPRKSAADGRRPSRGMTALKRGVTESLAEFLSPVLLEWLKPHPWRLSHVASLECSETERGRTPQRPSIVGRAPATLATPSCRSASAPCRWSVRCRDGTTAPGACQYHLCRPPRFRPARPVLSAPSTPGGSPSPPVPGANRRHLAPGEPTAHDPGLAVRPLDFGQTSRLPHSTADCQSDQP